MKRATYEDVLNAPEHRVAELLEGELILSPRPSARHAAAMAAIHGTLWSRFDGGERRPSGWIVLPEPELHFGTTVVVPDVAAWRRERLPSLPDQPWLEVAPDWICEVLSPSTARIDRGRKLKAYAEAGVSHAWLVNPVDRTLEVLSLKDGAWMLVAAFGGSDVARIQPFEDLEVVLNRLWPDTPEPGPDAA
jgi:Uma2 family endonuclease